VLVQYLALAVHLVKGCYQGIRPVTGEVAKRAAALKVGQVDDSL
jgi:hypothetical protein